MQINRKVKTTKTNTEHLLPNGAAAIIDADNKMLAYRKLAFINQSEFDWVRKDCQVPQKKNKKRG